MRHALAAAMRRNDLPEAAGLLRDGCEPDAEDAGGLTPPMVAAGLGAPQMAELPLAAGVGVWALEGRMGGSALHRAAQSGVVDVARLLLDWGAFIDLPSRLVGHTPLFDAVVYRRTAMAVFLLLRGAKLSLPSAHSGWCLSNLRVQAAWMGS